MRTTDTDATPHRHASRTRRIHIDAAIQHDPDTQHDSTQPSLLRSRRSGRSARPLLLLVYLLLSVCAAPALTAAASAGEDQTQLLEQQQPPAAPLSASASEPTAAVAVPVGLASDQLHPTSGDHTSHDPLASGSPLSPSSTPAPPAEDAAFDAAPTTEPVTHSDRAAAAATDGARHTQSMDATTTAERDEAATQSSPQATPATKESVEIAAVDSIPHALLSAPADSVPSSVAPAPPSAPSDDLVVVSTAAVVPLVSTGEAIAAEAAATPTPATAAAMPSSDAAAAAASGGSVSVAPAKDVNASSLSAINVSVRVLPVPVAQIVVNDSVGLNATLAALLANASAASVPVIVVVPAPIVPSVSVTPSVVLAEPAAAADSELPRLDAYKQTLMDIVAEKEEKKKSKQIEVEAAAAALSGAAVAATASADPASAVPMPSQAASVPSQPSSDPATADSVSVAPPAPPSAPAPLPASIPLGPESGDSDHDRDRFNYAAFDAGAKMLATSPGMKKANSILVSDDDRYLMVPCGAAHKHFVIQLSEDIMIDTIELANLEHYASSIKEFQIMGSASHPTTQWTLLGTYVAMDSTHKQVFTLPNKQWVRFIKLIWNSHYGDEYYCTLTYLRVYGTTMLETFHQEMQQAEVDVQEITQTIMQSKPGKNSKTEAEETTQVQIAAITASGPAAESSSTIEVEVSPTLLPIPPVDSVLAPATLVADDPVATSTSTPAVSDTTVADAIGTSSPLEARSPTELGTPAVADPAETDASNANSAPTSLGAVAPDPIPASSDSSLLSPPEDNASSSTLAPAASSALLPDAAIVGTVTDVLAAAAAEVDQTAQTETTAAIGTQPQQHDAVTTNTAEPPNGTLDSVAHPPVATDQLSHPSTAAIVPAEPSQPISDSPTVAAPAPSILVAELIALPIPSPVLAPSVPVASSASPIPDPTAVAAASAPPVLSHDARFPSLPSRRSGSDRASAASSSSGSVGQQSIFKSLTNRIKQLEIEQAMIHNYVSALADQYNRDMAAMRMRMDNMAHDSSAHRDRTEMQWREGWARINSTTDALSAANHRVLQSVKAQLERAQETTETVELVIQTQLWLSGLLFAVYFLGRWLLSLARYARKTLMRVCCWFRRRKRMTRHVHSKSSPSLMLTDGEFAQLQDEASQGNRTSKRSQRRSTAQHNRGPQRDHSRTMSMQPTQRPSMFTEPVPTSPFDPRATAVSVASAAAPAAPLSLSSSLSSSHLVSLNPRRAHAVASDPLFAESLAPAVALSPRPRIGLEPATASPSPRSPPAAHLSSLIPPCVEEESELAGSAPPSRQASPAPPPPPLSLRSDRSIQCASSIEPVTSPQPPLSTTSPARRFSLGLLPRWLTSPSSRRADPAATVAASPLTAGVEPKSPSAVNAAAVAASAASLPSVVLSPPRSVLSSTPTHSPPASQRSILRNSMDEHSTHTHTPSTRFKEGAHSNSSVSFAAAALEPSAARRQDEEDTDCEEEDTETLEDQPNQPRDEAGTAQLRPLARCM